MSQTGYRGEIIDGTDQIVAGAGEHAALAPRQSSAFVDSSDDWVAWGRSAPLLSAAFGANIEPFLASQSVLALWAETALMLASVVVVDYVTGPDLSFSVFYLMPVIFATWFLSRRSGLVMGVLSVSAWSGLEAISGAHYPSLFVPVWNASLRFAFVVIVLELVHLMKGSKTREASLARTDSLTGVGNGRSFCDRANWELAALRRTKRPITVAYLDLDHFKSVNDTLGHTEGDRLLQSVAKAIQGRLRATDLVARLGGDEFGILLPDTDALSAPDALEAIRNAVTRTIDDQWGVGCTIGAVTFEHAPDSVDFMVRASDELMYAGKRRGRGRVEHSVWPAPVDGENSQELTSHR